MPMQFKLNFGPHTDQIHTVNKVLQAKDTQLQAMQKLIKASEGAWGFCE